MSKTFALLNVIDHAEQRYDTCGDWIVYPGSNLVIKVSDTGNADYNFLIMIHELVEAYRCLREGVSQYDVDEYDIEYERNRKEGDTSEPGNSEDAPYHRQHVDATAVEKLVAEQLNINWDMYEECINSLYYPKTQSVNDHGE